MKVLVTGGAGYNGAVTATALEGAGHTPVILDSLLSGPEVYTRGRIFYQGDIADRDLLARVVREHPRSRLHHPYGGPGCRLGVGGNSIRVLP